MYIIRQEKREYQDIVDGRCNTMMVIGRCMQDGERIRFVEVDETGQRTGREAYAEIIHVYSRPETRKRLVKYRKVRELRVPRKNKASAAKRGKAKSSL